MKWEKYCVGELITTKKGFAFQSKKYVEYGVPIVRVTDFTLDSISDNDLKYYPISEKQNYLDFELHEKDVIIQTVGSWQNNPASVVGKVVHVPYFLEGALLNQNAVKLIPNDFIINDFLYYRLKTDEFKGHVIGEARGAANQASITLDTIKSFTFFLPPLETQQRIASILSAYDDLIENNQKQIKLLEEAAQRLYKEWFVDLRFPGHENTKIVDGVPEGWRKKQICNIADIKAGGDKPEIVRKDKSEKAPIPIYANGIEKDGLYGYTTKPVIEKESVTISARGTVGFVFLRRTPYVPIVRLLSVIPDSIPAIYLYYCLKNVTFERNGTSQQQITVPMVKNKNLLIADISVIDKFTSKVTEFHDKIDILKTQIELLTEARDRLLPKLMSGEIEV